MNIRRLIDRTKGRKDRRGTNAIEFALTAPVLFFIILATMDFGWYFAHRLVLETSTVRAARVASIQLQPGGDADAAMNVGTGAIDANDSPITKNAGLMEWEKYGLIGTPEFDAELLTTAGHSMVHVEATLDYASLAGWDKLLGVSPLPETITTTVARRAENIPVATPQAN